MLRFSSRYDLRTLVLWFHPERFYPAGTGTVVGAGALGSAVPLYGYLGYSLVSQEEESLLMVR